MKLKVKISLSSVLMYSLHLVFFFSMSVCNNCFNFLNFEKLIPKYLKNFCLSSFRRPECEILLPLLLLEILYEYSILVLFRFPFSARRQI